MVRELYGNFKGSNSKLCIYAIAFIYYLRIYLPFIVQIQQNNLRDMRATCARDILISQRTLGYITNFSTAEHFINVSWTDIYAKLMEEQYIIKLLGTFYTDHRRLLLKRPATRFTSSTRYIGECSEPRTKQNSSIWLVECITARPVLLCKCGKTDTLCLVLSSFLYCWDTKNQGSNCFPNCQKYLKFSRDKKTVVHVYTKCIKVPQ